MSEISEKNKERLFNAIQNLKDCAFGMQASYVPLCYSHDADDLVWDEQKKENFIRDLICFASNKHNYTPDLERPIYLFFDITLKFIAAACRFSEQAFVSLRKIAKVAYKPEPEKKCTFEYLIEAEKVNIDKKFNESTYWSNYDEFITYLIRIDNDLLFSCIKYALEEFVDNRELSAFSDTVAINNMITRVNRTASIILAEMRKRESSLEVISDES